jgi:predicted permease
MVTLRERMSDTRDSLRSLVVSVPRTSRTLRRSPGFVAIATLSLGVALGLSTSVFALIDAMTHPNSPYRDVDQLFEVHVFGSAKIRPSSKELIEGLRTIKGIEGVSSVGMAFDDLDAGQTVARGSYAFTPPGFFELLGGHPRLGRLPTVNDGRAESAAIVSDDFWKLRFANRRQIGDAQLTIHGHVYAIVGVMPPRANSPLGASLWIPQAADTSRGFGVPIVRLHAGVTPTVVQPGINAIMKRFTAVYGSPNDRPFAAALTTMRPDPLALKDVHRAMIGAAICVLIIACANVAALMLARATVRRRDYALRLALGASRMDIAREVIFEVAALAVIGSIAGAIVATWAVGLMTRASPLEMQWMGFPVPQWSVRVLGASLSSVMIAIAIAGGIPAWQASRTDPAGTLKESSGGTTGRAGTRFRWLVMAELALSMTLLVGASLMLKSVVLMARYDFGFDARSLLSVDVYINRFARDSEPQRSVAHRVELFRQSLERIRAVDGVSTAAMISQCMFDHRVVTTDRTIEGGKASTAPSCSNVSTDYFRTLSREMAEGRDFEPGDAAGDGAVILDQKTAKRLFPHESAVGRMLKLGSLASKMPWIHVVGVVKDKFQGFNPFPEINTDSSEVMFISAPDSSRETHHYVVRPLAGQTSLRVKISRALFALLPPNSYVRTVPWTQSYDDSLSEERFLALVFSLLGVASLVLGAAGLFSVVSYIAGLRMREFAVRIALGATRENVVKLVLSEALIMALGGTAVGAGFGMWAGFMLWAKMYGVYPVDATALIGAEVTLLIVTMVACLGPAVRAMKADPVQVMRAT